MTQLVSLPDMDGLLGYPLRSGIVPQGYDLTTRYLCHEYIDDLDGCDGAVHAHAEHMVIWPEHGSAAVDVDGVRRSLTLGQGVWVPAGTPHRVERTADTPLAAVYIVTAAWPGDVGEVRSVAISHALRELLKYLAVTAMPRDQRLRAQRVCCELIVDEPRPSIELPIPRDSRLSRIARTLLDDPADGRTIEDWGWITSTSARTLARAFRSETGMTFSQWRTTARMSAAVRLLGQGHAVGYVARRVGYATISAFSAAFHRTMGQPPHCFGPTTRH